MELKNAIFANVFDYLCREYEIKDQKDFAARTKISKNTITNILNGKTGVSDKTLWKLNEAFGNIFNMQYLRGIDPFHMLISDVDNDYVNAVPYVSSKTPILSQKEKEVIKEINNIDPLTLQAGVESLLELASQLIKENESLRRDLQESIREVHALADQLQNIHIPRQYITSKTEVLKAADSEEELKK